MTPPNSRFVLAAAALAAFAANASAQTVIRVDDDASPGGDGSSWADAYDDLQDAIARAEVDLLVREIWVAAGTYVPGSSPTDTFEMLPNVEYYGGFAGNETSLSERDPAANLTILSGDVLGNDVVTGSAGSLTFGNYDDNVRHVVTASSVGPTAVLDGFRVRSGYADDPSTPYGNEGAGILIVSASPRLANLDVRANVATGDFNGGGGIYAEPGLAVLRIESSRIGRNAATRGGGVLLVGGFLDLVDSTVDGNQATGGGGVRVELAATTIRDSEFFKNQATTGASLQLFRSTGVVEDSEFRDSNATSGAGIYAYASDTTVRRCTFDGNDSTVGAGISFVQGSYGAFPGLAEDCTFVDNLATSGAGLYVNVYDSGPASQTIVQRCTFRDNQIQFGLGAGGAAIAVAGTGDPANQPTAAIVFQCEMFESTRGHVQVDAYGVMQLINCTLANDFGFYSGLQVVLGRIDLENTIVWDTSGFNQVQGDIGGVNARYSNVFMTTGELPGPGNLSADPGFVDLAAGDLRLTPGSACIDAGDPSYTTIGVDVHGDPRRLDGNLDGVVEIDIGAAEYVPVRLDVVGTIAPGEIVTFDTTGVPGLGSLMTAGTYGEGTSVQEIGSYLIDPSQKPFSVIGWFDTPSSFPIQLPQVLPAGEALTFVQVAFGGLGVTASNAVTLQF